MIQVMLKQHGVPLTHGIRSKVCTQERHCRIPGGQFGTSEIYSDVVLIGMGLVGNDRMA